MDRTVQGPVNIPSSQGGMDIEQVAHENPSAIVTLPIDINKGLYQADAERVAVQLGFCRKGVKQVADIFQKHYKLFIEKDANLVEINPLVVLASGDVACMNAKLDLMTTQILGKKTSELRDITQEDQRGCSS
ncbi:hypothetical protein HK096_007199 [Nowakowskiella sp. JEL0078]|nr:hypothetical protein HK096_007199 [Nowakowskiella sp. JEL0078]